MFDNLRVTHTPGNATGSVESVLDWSSSFFQADLGQKRAFEVILSSFLLTFYREPRDSAVDIAHEATPERVRYDRMKASLEKLAGLAPGENLRMLLHGPGGSGKSHVVNTIMLYATEYCSLLGHQFTKRTITVTAVSGVAATFIGGETTHGSLGLNRKERHGVPSEVKDAWADTRLLIIDEVSFAGNDLLENIDQRTRNLMNRWEPYGGTNVVFAGDYFQLEPVRVDPIYKGYVDLENNNCRLFMKYINCFIELKGRWRFVNDPQYGEVMSRFRDGTPTVEDITYINSRVGQAVPEDIQVATHTNRDRDAINTGVFDRVTVENKPENGSVLKTAMIIFMDEISTAADAKTPFVPITSNAIRKYLYEQCGEDDCSGGNYNDGSRVDPVLKLYKGAPFMMTKNKDVGNGQANGSCVTIRDVTMKPNESPFQLRLHNGTTILAAFANQVATVNVQHVNPKIRPSTCNVTMETHTFYCRLKPEVDNSRSIVRMHGKQFPLVSNSATTGHKLQGATLKTLYVSKWIYKKNWAYVVLSRVTQLDGLYLKEPLLPTLQKYAKPEEVKTMLQDLVRNKGCEMLGPIEYHNLLYQTRDALPIRPSVRDAVFETNEPLLAY
jgi:hypothetical protein